MKKMIRNLILAGTILMMASCIDEINLALEESNQAIVIEAWIGNIPAETYVKVYRTSPYVSGVLNPSFIPVPVRSVVIQQSEGEDILFIEDQGGIFRQPQNFTPVSGRNYRLALETANGDVYESAWETMPPFVEIEDIVPSAFEKQVIIPSGQSLFSQIRTFADVKAQITDPGVGDLGYYIQSSGITELYTASNSDNCACTCYENDPNIFAGMNITSNSLFQNRVFQLSIGEIPLSSLGRFFVSSRLKVLSKSNFDYLSQIDLQQRNSGSIFDPAPFRIKGNIKKRGSEQEIVLGGFFLFQESTFEKLIFRGQIRSESIELRHSLDPLPFVNGDCTEFYTSASTFVPPAFRP